MKPITASSLHTVIITASLRTVPRGAFMNATTGEVLSQDGPAPTDVFPILAGPWPNRNVGCRQARCLVCHTFVGMSPRGWELHTQNPEGRPLLCEECFAPFVSILKELMQQVENPE